MEPNHDLLAGDDKIPHPKMVHDADGNEISLSVCLLTRAAMLASSIRSIHVDSHAVGARIRDIRVNMLNLTQKGLAILLQAGAPTTVASWERGENLPDIETLAHIALYAGISVDYLLTGRDYVTTASTPHRVFSPYCFPLFNPLVFRLKEILDNPLLIELLANRINKKLG